MRDFQVWVADSTSSSHFLIRLTVTWVLVSFWCCFRGAADANLEEENLAPDVDATPMRATGQTGKGGIHGGAKEVEPCPTKRTPGDSR